MKTIFISSGVSTLSDRLFNEQIVNVIREFPEDFQVYSPLLELPPDVEVPIRDILAINTKKIESCDYFFCNLYKPGLGVAYELGIAMTLKKKLILFRSCVDSSIGSMLNAIWWSNNSQNNVTDLERLRFCLTAIKEREARYSR